jgi:hypothetical protein
MLNLQHKLGDYRALIRLEQLGRQALRSCSEPPPRIVADVPTDRHAKSFLHAKAVQVLVHV